MTKKEEIFLLKKQISLLKNALTNLEDFELYEYEEDLDNEGIEEYTPFDMGSYIDNNLKEVEKIEKRLVLAKNKN